MIVILRFISLDSNKFKLTKKEKKIIESNCCFVSLLNLQIGREKGLLMHF